MLAPNPASILDQIFGRAGIALTQESTSDDHALSRRLMRGATGVDTPASRASNARLRRKAAVSATLFGFPDLPVDPGRNRQLMNAQ